MFTDFSTAAKTTGRFENSALKRMAGRESIQSFSASDSCCKTNVGCKGYTDVQTDNSAPPSGAADTESVYVCDRDWKTRICDGLQLWVGSARNCKPKPKEETEISDKTIDDVLKDDFLEDEENIESDLVSQDKTGVYQIKNWQVY